MENKTPESLNCPNCGAAVSSDSTQCEFCKSRLKTVGCPKCLGLMFLGSKFCSHCGAEATAVAVDDEKGGRCPRCGVELEGLNIADTHFRECTRCGGLWTNPATFEALCSDQERQSAVLSFIADRNYVVDSVPIKYVPCPDCKQLMNRSNFARMSGVIIDLCKQHGVWFDAGELPKIIEFINGGGLSRAREREKIDLEEERAKVRDEQRKLVAMELKAGRRFSREHEESGIGSVISALFGL